MAKLRGIGKIDGVDHGRFYGNAAELGRDAKLTEIEYRQLKTELGYFPEVWPAGFSKNQAKAIRNEVNRPVRNAAERKRKQALAADKAARVQMVADLDCRQSAILVLLTDQYQTVLELMEALAPSPAFRRADGKGLLAGSSLRVAILRELRKPALAGRVEIKRDRYRNGRPMLLIRRRQ
jgi:hypothetical protein